MEKTIQKMGDTGIGKKGNFVDGLPILSPPLQKGINFACAIGGFYVHTIELLLLLSFAVLAGYIIPGHMLNAKFRRENKK